MRKPKQADSREPAWLTVDPNPTAERYALRLYLTGTTPSAVRALCNTRQFCDAHLAGRYDLEVVDIYQQPDRLADAQIVVAPTLVKHAPLPVRRLVGDMSNTSRMLQGLGLSPA
jgi:circadian clock protein KaiB